MYTPSVCVIIATYNAAATVEKAVKSALAQDYPKLEVLVVDGASTDSTVAVVKKIKNSRLQLVSEPDNGIYDAWNKGVSRTNAERIIFIGSDDWFTGPSVIANFWAQVPDSASACPLLYGSLIAYGIDGVPLRKMGSNWKSPWNFAGCHLWSAFPIPIMATFFLKGYIEYAGKFNTEFKIMADIDLVLKIAKEKSPLYIHSEPLLAMGHGGISTRPGSGLTAFKEARKVRGWHGLGALTNLEFILRSLKAIFIYAVVKYIGMGAANKIIRAIHKIKKSSTYNFLFK